MGTQVESTISIPNGYVFNVAPCNVTQPEQGPCDIQVAAPTDLTTTTTGCGESTA